MSLLLDIVSCKLWLVSSKRISSWLTCKFDENNCYSVAMGRSKRHRFNCLRIFPWKKWNVSCFTWKNRIPFSEGGPFSENKQIIVMYGGTQWNSAPVCINSKPNKIKIERSSSTNPLIYVRLCFHQETFKRVGIRKKIYPMSNEETLWHEQDIGVGELEHVHLFSCTLLSFKH